VIPSLNDWMEGTKVSGRKRSADLATLDAAIGAYHQDRGRDSRKQVKAAWLAWKAKHAKTEAKLFDNKRNASGLLEVLNAEFVGVSALPQRVGAMSRVALAFPDKKPSGFSNCDENRLADRIDKAFVDAQAVLRIVTGRLVRGGPDVDELVTLWFGSATRNEVLDAFNRVQDFLTTRLRGNNGTTIKIEWILDPDKAGTIAAVPTLIPDTMQFYTLFFDNEITITTGRFTSAPKPDPERLQVIKGFADKRNALQKKLDALGRLDRICLRDGHTFGACIERSAQKSGQGTFQFNRQLKEDEAFYKFPRDKTPAETRIAIAKAQDAVNDDVEQLTALFPKAKKMLATTSGVVIHELSHMVLGTEDLPSPTLHGGGFKCYGPGLCSFLAAERPSQAIKNADNFRLFAECCQFD
jgi:hypothetical protein